MGGESCSFNDCFLPSIVLATLFGILLLLVIFALFKYLQLARIITAIDNAWHSDGTCYSLTSTDRCKIHTDNTLGDVPQSVVASGARSYNVGLAWKLADCVARVELAPNIKTPPSMTWLHNFNPLEGPTFAVAWMNGTSLVIAFRCTVTHSEIQEDLDAFQVEFDTGLRVSSPLKSVPNVPGSAPYVHSGFYSVTYRYLPEIISILKAQKPKLLFLCGHSLGGAVATLTGVSLAEQFPDLPITAYVYGTPRVGNSKFNDRVMSLSNLTVWRTVNHYDQIQDLPYSVTPNFPHPQQLPFYYEHAGYSHVYYDNRGSWKTNHNLPNYLSYLSNQSSSTSPGSE